MAAELMTSSDVGLAGTFRTHANYLRAFATLAGFTLMVSPRRARARLAELALGFPVPDVKPGEAALVFDCLRRAWGTELLLNVGRRYATEEELMGLANSWGVVQAYYAAYGAVQALIVAEGRNRPASHPATQKQVATLWCHRGAALPLWSFSVGSPSDSQANADGCVNGPDRLLDPSVHAWSASTPTTCWDLVAMALRSTRQHAVDEQLKRRRREKVAQRRKEWNSKQQERTAGGKAPLLEPVWPQKATLTATEKKEISEAVRPHTMLDYLYRLRIKANYEDARMFTDGPEQPGESAAVARDLVALTSATLLVHEVRTAKLIGKAAMMKEVERWLGHNSPPGPDVGLAVRLDVLKGVL